MLATCINHAFIKALGGVGPLCPAATGIRMRLVAGDWRGTKWVRPEEGLCWRNEADSVEKNQDQREPWAPGGAESNCSCLLWLCHHRASVITMGCNATALGALWGLPASCLSSPSVFLLSFPSPFCGLSVPMVPYPKFLSPADIIALLPAALVVISPDKIRTAKMCRQWGGKWEKKKKVWILLNHLLFFQSIKATEMNKGSHWLIGNVVWTWIANSIILFSHSLSCRGCPSHVLGA